jgi:hypothetical protein
LLDRTPLKIGSWPKITSGKAAGPLGAVVADMPSVFQRLVYVVSFNCLETRRRLGDDCPGQFPEWVDGGENARAAIVRQHQLVFEDWLCLSLEQKLADLEEWASRLGRPRADMARDWLQPRPLACLLPPGVMAPERDLFRYDLELLLPINLAWESSDMQPHAPKRLKH